ncbi:hypothetical protein GQ53DRAFT_712005 [Thozetella sp. PMI_491]|nr:hypothetical protein GQ53DRAFT_712005 [Thozetella sp. PMI_491]
MPDYHPLQPGPSGHRPPNKGWLKRNRNVVAQSCETCRRLKSKCDGARPHCWPCVSRGKTCTYAEANAKDLRLESLERLFQTLRTSTPDETEELVRRIKGDDLDLSKLDSGAGLKPEEPTGTQPDPSATDASSSKRPQSASPRDPTFVKMGTDISSEMPADMNVWRPTINRTHSAPTYGDRSSQPEAGEAWSTKYTHLGFPWIPPPDVARHTVDSFFDCSGRLFHLFSRDQMSDYFDIIYQIEGTASGPALELALGCLLSVAAVGAQYAAGGTSHEMEKSLYTSAKGYLDPILESHPLDAIKVCTLLAMYNIMDKTTVALSYVEVGLSLCRRNGLDCKTCQRPGLSQVEWLGYRRAWRTLLFFSSWLSSTLGYISGNDILSTGLSVRRLLRRSASQTDHLLTSSPDIVVQNELVRIAFLKAHMLRVHLAFKDLTLLTIRSIMSDLQEWYRKLPKELRLSNLGQEGLPVEAKRSLCHVHLLYLGAIMLLYRRIASQFALSSNIDRNRTVQWKPMEEVIVKYSKEAIAAAEHSARILKLLMEDHGIFKRCWLVIFQAYTAGLILFHSISQKLVHGISLANSGDELTQSQNCLSVLAFCASADPVAQKLHASLLTIHERLHPHTSPDLEMKLKPESEGLGLYLLFLKPTADPTLGELSQSIITILCQPFGNSDESDPSRPRPFDKAQELDTSPDGDYVRYKCAIERLEWDFESSMPFLWELGATPPPQTGSSVPGSGRASVARSEGRGPHEGSLPEEGNRDPSQSWLSNLSVLAGDSELKSFQGLHEPNRFLGSAEPSGWTGAEVLKRIQ